MRCGRFENSNDVVMIYMYTFMHNVQVHVQCTHVLYIVYVLAPIVGMAGSGMLIEPLVHEPVQVQLNVCGTKIMLSMIMINKSVLLSNKLAMKGPKKSTDTTKIMHSMRGRF